MNDNIIFYNSFIFNDYHFMNYRTSDNRAGIHLNFLAYMKRGTARICEEGRTVSIREGDVFFLPVGCKYVSHWYGSPEIEFISLGFRFLPNFENHYYEPQVIDASEEEIALMQQIVSRKPLDCQSVGLFYTLVSRLMPKMTFRSTGKHTELVERVTNLILSNPSLTVSELAKECAVSDSTLYSAFRAHSEKSINEIKRTVVMERAKALLISTDYSVEEISRSLEFSSGAYFRKCFHETFGISPRQMRQNTEIKQP